MTRPLLNLLAEARRAGLIIARRGEGQLVIRGPRSCEPLVRSLLAQKKDVLIVLPVYTGAAERLDWRREPILATPQQCVLCRRSTLLIEPYDGRPCHKSCAETAIRWGTIPVRTRPDSPVPAAPGVSGSVAPPDSQRSRRQTERAGMTADPMLGRRPGFGEQERP